MCFSAMRVDWPRLTDLGKQQLHLQRDLARRPLHRPGGIAVGQVTSGLLSPSTDRPIAMGYVPPDCAAHGTRLDALVRGKPVPMEVIPLPFIGTRYRKS